MSIFINASLVPNILLSWLSETIEELRGTHKNNWKLKDGSAKSTNKTPYHIHYNRQLIETHS